MCYFAQYCYDKPVLVPAWEVQLVTKPCEFPGLAWPTKQKYMVPGALASLVLPAAGLPEVSNRGELSIDGPPPKPAQGKTTHI
jgi:hypothetical protein